MDEVLIFAQLGLNNPLFFKHIDLLLEYKIMEQILWKKDNISILLDEEVPCVIWKLIGYPKSSEAYRDSVVKLYDILLAQLASFPHIKILNDASEMTNVLPEDFEWAKKWASEKLSTSPIQYRAVVMPVKYFARLATEQYLEIFDDIGLIVKTFQTVAEAKSWLRSLA